MRKKRAIALLCACSLFASSILSFGATFKDMKDSKGKDHWSTPFVTDITSKGLVGGYIDGTFRPNNPVTRIESIVFISRLFPTDQVKSVYADSKAKWEAKLKNNHIPEFAKSAVVFGLEKNWYTEAYLKEFMNANNKTQKEAQRYEFVVYLVRAMDWHKELSNAAVVKYKDANKIPKQAVPFVELLGKKGVIATEGEFNPLKTVTRGEVAKMLSISYPNSAKGKGLSTPPPSVPVTPPGNGGKVTMPSGVLVEGTIRGISNDNATTILTVMTNGGKLEAYTNRSSGVVVSLDGQSALVSQLREGFGVKLYTDGLTLKGVEATSVNISVNKDITGEIVSVSSNTIKVRIGNATEEFGFANNATIVKDSKNVRPMDLVPGDSIFAKIQNSLVVSAEAKTVKKTLKNAVVKGITSYSNGTASLLIADERGNEFQMEYTSNSQAYMNNKRVGVTSIVVGFEADVYANSNQIVDITLYGASKGSVLTGVITESNPREDYFYIRSSEGKEVKVTLSRSVTIVEQITGNSKSVYDLDKGKNVILNGYEGVNSFEASKIAYY